MENLTDEQVTNWKDDISSVISNLLSNLRGIVLTTQAISNDVRSDDPNLANSWTSLRDTISDSCKALNSKNEILNDTITTFINTVVALNEEMISTVQLAENEFTDFYNRIAAI